MDKISTGKMVAFSCLHIFGQLSVCPNYFGTQWYFHSQNHEKFNSIFVPNINKKSES